MMQFEKRLSEFVHYHIHGDGECNGITLRRWADIHCVSPADRAELAYMFAVTYCVESAIILLKNRTGALSDADGWKRRLVFQSDRKYIRMRDAFNKCLQFYAGNRELIRAFGGLGELDLKKWIPVVEGWPYFGRFSAYLFLETIAQLIDCRVLNAAMEWGNGATATSGLLNLYCYDEAASRFDRERTLVPPFTEGALELMLEPVLSEIRAQGGDANITMVETSLCAYRKFFKGSRYNGYYLDRMLEEIYAMQADFPQESAELMEIRKTIFDHRYLGEVGGWKGIRKECKKLYKERGIIM